MYSKAHPDRPGRRLAHLTLACALLTACEGPPQATYTPEYGAAPGRARAVYRFAVHPLHNPQRLTEVYGPIVAYLNERLGGPTLQFEAARSYEDFESKLYGRQYDFSVTNPLETLRSVQSGHRIFAKLGDDDTMRGVILVRRDSGIHRVEQLKGKAVSFPAPTAIAATMMPLWYLHTHGLDANRDVRRIYTGSQESSIMSAYLGTSAAAATWRVPWQAFQRNKPELAAELVMRWETPYLVNVGVVARDDVPAEVVERVGALLTGLHESEEGRTLLRAIPISRFEPASTETYGPVGAFMAEYEKAIR